MKYGDKIQWRFRHHYNSKSSSLKIRTGIFIGLIKHTKRYNGDQLAMVQFERNERVSRVPFKDLEGI